MWQMNRISKNTLLNISKYSNKLIKWAKYVFESNQPIIINELSNLDSLTDQVQLLEAFDKDLIKNVNDLYELQKLIITTQEDGTIPELNGEEKNLKVLFGDNYDEKNRLLKLPAITLSIDKPIQKEDIKSIIIKNFLDIDTKEYKLLLKTKDKLKDISISDLQETKDKINYVINKADIDFVSKYTKKIADLVNSIFDIRKNLDLEEKDLIDTRITSGRTMIDGVLENSTYISKHEGIYNISLKHKGQEELIEKLYESVKNSGYISGVEIDQDTDLNKVLFIVNQIKDLHLNIDKEFEFKIRKLGNYRYNGMYLHDNDIVAAEFGFSSNVLNIVSVDVNAPTALIHELVHLVDLSNEEFLYSKNRKEIINYFSKKLTDNGIKDFYSKLDYEYLLKGNEIIARLGEVGYILNKYDYKGHEAQEDLLQFINKVRECQKLEEKGVLIPENLSEIDFDLFKQKQYLIKKFDSTFINENEKFIPVVKNIDFYLKNKKSFFDIESLNQDELMLIKEYSKSYFNVLKKEFLKLDNIEMLKNVYEENENEKVESVAEKTTRKKYLTDDFIFSKINTLNIENVLEELDKNEVISWKEFLNEYGSQRHHLFRTSFSINEDKKAAQIDLNNKIIDHLIKKDDKENIANFINSYMLGMTSIQNNYKSTVYLLDKEVKRLEIKDIKFIEESLRYLPECLKKAFNYLEIDNLDFNVSSFRPQFAIDKEGLVSVFNKMENILNNFEPTSLMFIRIVYPYLYEIDQINEVNYYNNITLEKHVSSLIDSIDKDKLNKFRDIIAAEILRHKEPLLEMCKKDFIKSIELNSDVFYNYNGNYYGRNIFTKFVYLKEEFIKNNIEEIKEAIELNKLTSKELNALNNNDIQFIKNNLSFKVLKKEEGLKLLEKLTFEDITGNAISLNNCYSYDKLRNHSEVTKSFSFQERQVLEKMLAYQNNKSPELCIAEYKELVEKECSEKISRSKDTYERNKFLYDEIKDFNFKIIKQIIDKNKIDDYNTLLSPQNDLLKKIKKAMLMNENVKYSTEEIIENYKQLTAKTRTRSFKI